MAAYLVNNRAVAALGALSTRPPISFKRPEDGFVVRGPAIVFYGASILLAAIRGHAGCEVMAASNCLLRRDDQTDVSCSPRSTSWSNGFTKDVLRRLMGPKPVAVACQ